MRISQLTFASSMLYLSITAAALFPRNEAPKIGNLRADRELQSQSSNEEAERAAWIVEFIPKTEMVAEKAMKLAKDNGGNVGFVYEHAMQGFVFHGKNIQGISNNPHVLSVTPDIVTKVSAQNVPTGIRRIYSLSKTYMSLASSSCYCDAVVAVLDTGVDFEHPDLRVNTTMSVDCTIGNATQKCVQGRGDDDHGHGTHVAGIVGAIDNDIGVLGVCPGAEIWSIKILDSQGFGVWSSVLAGLDYVASHGETIDVANMSLGNPGCYVPLCNAIGRAKATGVAFAVSAGNDNMLASDFMPPCCAGVLAVSALGDSDGKPGGRGPRCRRTTDDTIAAFSNYGSSVNMTAPGVCITSTFLGGRYATLTGTSMASPHVAGALAVLASNNHTGDVDSMYTTLVSNGNYRFQDKVNDTHKEPLLDMRRLPDARMIGSC